MRPNFAPASSSARSICPRRYVEREREPAIRMAHDNVFDLRSVARGDRTAVPVFEHSLGQCAPEPCRAAGDEPDRRAVVRCHASSPF